MLNTLYLVPDLNLLANLTLFHLMMTQWSTLKTLFRIKFKLGK